MGRKPERAKRVRDWLVVDDFEQQDALIEELEIQIHGVAAALLNLFDVFSQILQTHDIAKRTEIVKRVQEMLAPEKAELAALECQREVLHIHWPARRKPFSDIDT